MSWSYKIYIFVITLVHQNIEFRMNDFTSNSYKFTNSIIGNILKVPDLNMETLPSRVSIPSLYELHNQLQDNFLQICNHCYSYVETRYHCTICDVSMYFYQSNIRTVLQQPLNSSLMKSNLFDFAEL